MPYKEKSGKWRAVVKIGSQRVKQKFGFSKKRDARTWEKEERRKILSSLSGLDLLTVCCKYKIYAEKFVKKTKQEKEAMITRILDHWGDNAKIAAITPEMVQDYLNDQKETRSANAANKERKNLKAMFAWAKKPQNCGLEHNPVEYIEKFKHERRAQYTPPEADVLKILAVASRQDRMLLECYLHTAARRSEIFRWTWIEDINFETRRVRLGSRKNRMGIMQYTWLPMNKTLHNTLKWIWDNRKFKSSPYVFVCDHPGPFYGKPYTARRRFMAGLCKRAKVKPFGFHALRRYVASILADKHKASTKTIQAVLRHKNINTTDRYIHRLNDDLTSTMELLDDPAKKTSVPQIGTPKNKKVGDNGR